MSTPTVDPREAVIRATLREHVVECAVDSGARWCLCGMAFSMPHAHRTHVAREIVRALDEREGTV